MSKLIVGCGTGRCGTKSLSILLGNQYLEATHEMYKWNIPTLGGQIWADSLKGLARAYTKGVADVALQWVWYAEHFLTDSSTRMVCLQRNRADTIASYERKAPLYNHWQVHNGKEWAPNKWDVCFPKYDAKNRTEAIGMYWDAYYERAHKLQEKYPTAFKIFSTGKLNTHEGQTEILKFVGISENRMVIGDHIHTNRTI